MVRTPCCGSVRVKTPESGRRGYLRGGVRYGVVFGGSYLLESENQKNHEFLIKGRNTDMSRNITCVIIHQRTVRVQNKLYKVPYMQLVIIPGRLSLLPFVGR